ncbi:hypothetical protein PRZ48_013406 [Zasmidium cellare]|uniref:CN hydrolase domain-containing protein n=1 Tax=Zasmidium cellare TaxID=395010 RepID=A0ABR0E0Z1_ZASCE|nr:hypothetical protein PRZ48_013406 [Zasmidium cellare]
MPAPATTFKAAAVHAAPVFMDKDATIQKTIETIQNAKAQGVKLLVFPETWIPGYPAFIMAYAPMQTLGLISQYSKQSMAVLDSSGRPSPDMQKILAVCREAGVSIVLGISEISGQSKHTIFSSQVFVSAKGELLGVHRKLMPTYAEKNAWANGGGATLKCWSMPLADEPSQTYRIGGLICSENAIYTAKDALVMEGEQIHAASWPAMCAFKAMKTTYAERIRTFSMSHAFSAGAFVIAASMIFKHDHLAWFEKQVGPQPGEIVLEGSGWSGIVAPGTGILAQEQGVEEKLVVAEINLAMTDSPAKVISDMSGHYRRPEVLKSSVNRDKIWEDDELVAIGGS